MEERQVRKEQRQQKLQKIEEDRAFGKEEKYLSCLRDIEALNDEIAVPIEIKIISLLVALIMIL